MAVKALPATPTFSDRLAEAAAAEAQCVSGRGPLYTNDDDVVTRRSSDSCKSRTGHIQVESGGVPFQPQGNYIAGTEDGPRDWKGQIGPSRFGLRRVRGQCPFDGNVVPLKRVDRAVPEAS